MGPFFAAIAGLICMSISVLEFKLLHGLGNCLYPVRGSHGTVDVWVSGGDGCATVVVIDSAMPRHEIAAESVRVRLVGARRPVSALLSRIDEDHVNPRRAWQEMGEPNYPNPRQVEALHTASALRPQVHPLRVAEGLVEFELVMPPQSVAALKIELTRL